MTTATLDIEIPADQPVISFRRVVKAPPALVFDAFTKPEHMRNWYGPRNLTMPVCDIDLRVGGAYRFVHRAPDGAEFAFSGTFRELDPPRRIVQTWTYEGMPEDETLDTVEFAEVEGGTLVTGTSVHTSVAARDAHVAAGMEGGMRESYDRLDELVAKLG
jgi:uncharacterized protein YndB with AHSA1/START domain